MGGQLLLSYSTLFCATSLDAPEYVDGLWDYGGRIHRSAWFPASVGVTAGEVGVLSRDGWSADQNGGVARAVPTPERCRGRSSCVSDRARRRVAGLKQQLLAVQETLQKRRQELSEMQARIDHDYEEDRRKFEMEWEMRYNNLRLRDEVVAGNSIKAGEEQDEESMKDELLDRVRRYKVGSTKAELAETTNVVLEKLFVAESGSGARVVDMEPPAGTSGSDRALASFSWDCESEELALRKRPY
ncbi:hypothetical protein quinque_014184 [Culex quinquefasciatus]